MMKYTLVCEQLLIESKGAGSDVSYAIIGGCENELKNISTVRCAHRKRNVTGKSDTHYYLKFI